ncbi:MAG TPA: hypothetical protein PLL20_03490 [Phycisphaerae bacterium]|nr:hypothetical protein [Phycisphaerae bacterium]HRR84287.1 hypothetical protein [Phycisphaerae bacterium]
MQLGSDVTSSDVAHAIDAGADRGQPVVVVVREGGRHTVWWVIAVLLAIIASALVLRLDEGRFMRSAVAQTGGAGGGLVGARGIYAFSGQLTPRTYGVFMLDVDTGTIWCYELDRASNDELLLRLVAARTWTSDRYLEEFNVADPVPGAVRMMVQQQRAIRQDQADLPVTSAPAKGPVLP